MCMWVNLSWYTPVGFTFVRLAMLTNCFQTRGSALAFSTFAFALMLAWTGDVNDPRTLAAYANIVSVGLDWCGGKPIQATKAGSGFLAHAGSGQASINQVKFNGHSRFIKDLPPPHLNGFCGLKKEPEAWLPHQYFDISIAD